MELTLPDPTQIVEYGDLAAHAFAFAPADAPVWFLRAGHDNVRVLCRGPQLLGGLFRIPMGQWFGGRCVPMVGIAGVAVAPEHRGGGVATRLMHECVRQLHRERVPLSALYPATLPLYQRAGYERAGARYQIEVPVRELPTCRDGQIQRWEAADPGMRSLYQSFARRRNGFLERGDYVWGRVFKPFNKPEAQAWGMEGQGYAVWLHERTGSGELELIVTDLVALTAGSARRLLGVLADYRSITSVVRWSGAAPDLATWVLPEKHFQVKLQEYWMLRLVDLPGALQGRGYPRHLSATLELEVEDELIAENSGRWVLRLEQGQGRLERGGEGRLALDIRALAALYSGFLPCATLVAAGQARCDADTAELASLVFAGPAPAMSDFF